MARYRITHETEYRYHWPVSLSQQLLHLQPRSVEWQRVSRSSLLVSPHPVRRQGGEDCFGNPCTRLEINEPHTVLRVVADISRAVSASLDPAETYEAVVSNLSRAFRFNLAELNLWDEAAQVLRPARLEKTSAVT